MKSQSKLTIKNISLVFEEDVIKDISLEVSGGEIVSIIGPSGCGKSTLFNVISCILKQDRGVIKIDGKEEKQRQGKFGYMFQEPLLFPWLKVFPQQRRTHELPSFEYSEETGLL